MNFINSKRRRFIILPSRINIFRQNKNANTRSFLFFKTLPPFGTCHAHIWVQHSSQQGEPIEIPKFQMLLPVRSASTSFGASWFQTKRSNSKWKFGNFLERKRNGISWSFGAKEFTSKKEKEKNNKSSTFFWSQCFYRASKTSETSHFIFSLKTCLESGMVPHP